MPTITIDGHTIDCRDGVPVIQAALDAGLDIPHYCYHPGLSVVASCRLCLMEMKMPHPQTGELGWAPKLFPSCQTPVKDGMEVRFDSEKVQQNQRSCMEYFLLNHPLDCPVCDQAGECHLQDYSYRFGSAESRMVDQKLKNAKKDIGPATLLYSDRCVMCTRCVRFSDEVSGSHELCVVNRGSRSEIDVFPGLPLSNPLQGNVVDLCPVGALLDKDFLFQQRVWYLTGTPSICPGCSTGCAIRVDQNDNVVYRLKPRLNPGVNDWWMCDEGRFGFKYVLDQRRITVPLVRRGSETEQPAWETLAELLRVRLEDHVSRRGGDHVALVLSPMLACEEAWLLVRIVRSMAPDATIVTGPAPIEGEDQCFPIGVDAGDAKFTIRNEKCPNQRGIEIIASRAGGSRCDFDAFLERAGKGDFSAAWITGGYAKEWVSKELVKSAGKLELLIVQDMFPSDLSNAASVLLPAGAWVERDGCFVNHNGAVQSFERAVEPPEHGKSDGQLLFELAGFVGLYSGERVREMMAEEMDAFGKIQPPVAMAAHQH